MTQVYTMFETDVNKKPFDWLESANKELQVLVNCSLEQNAQMTLSKTNVIDVIDEVFKAVVVMPEEEEQKEALSRILNLIGKLMKTADGSIKIINSIEIISRVLLYYMTDESDFFKNALLTMHACCRHPEFRDICFKQHKFTMKSFDPFVAQANKKFKEIFEKQAWDEYTNICASITAFCGCFPERKGDFKEVIPPIIKVMGDKLDSVRKNSAILLAKLVEDHEDNKKIMRDNHGTEILMSVQQSLLKQN